MDTSNAQDVSFSSIVHYELDEENNILYFEVNEYDLLMYERRTAEAYLLQHGYTQDEIDASRTNAPEQRILDLASLDEDVLAQSYGYSNEQITILKAYDGSPLEEYSQLRAVTATLSGNIISPSHSTSSISALFTWNWSSPPAFYVYTDVVGARWDGTNPSALQMNLALDTSSSYASVTYCSTADNSYDYLEYQTFKNTSPYSHTEVAIERMGTSLTSYAKNGAMKITVKVPETTTGTIAEAQFVFAYGMTTSSSSYSIAFPASFSITFGSKTTEAFNKAVRISASGTITYY